MHNTCEKNNTDIIRYNPSIENGLSSEDVECRKKANLTNKVKMVVGKSYLRIFLTNIFSFYNVVLFAMAGLLIYGGYYTSLFFLLVITFNICICLYEDITARRLMSKMHILTAPKAIVVRNGIKEEIAPDDLVLDDVYLVKANSQICADSIILSGSIAVNESSLTGESHSIFKKPGDIIYSGSYVVSGEASTKVDKVGKDSYIQSLQSVAKKFKRSKSEILKSLSGLFNVISIIVIVVLACTLALYGAQGRFYSVESFKEQILPITTSTVSLVPAGLYLLTSVALAVSVIALGKKKAHVQDFYSVEMLARTNILCIDKTGTITDGSLVVKKVIPFDDKKESDIITIACSIVESTKDHNATAEAIRALAGKAIIKNFKKILPFNSENKYAAVASDNESYIVGALEFVNSDNEKEVSGTCDDYAKQGYRVIVVAVSKNIDITSKFNGKSHIIGVIVLQDSIKKDAIKTFEWFDSNNVSIRVISGDNMYTTRETARLAGIKDTDKCISLEGMSLEEVYAIAPDYNIFARVSPEQKERIIASLQNKGNVVAMTGDGVNDILALKKADCSIAMASGSEATRNVSHIVLMDSDFSSMPNIVGEGRRVINNLQRTGSLFVTKTIFALFFSVLFLVLSLCKNDPTIKYPFSTNNMYIWEILGIGLTAFFIALEANNESVEGHFLENLFKKAVPASIASIVGASTIFVLYLMQSSAGYIGNLYIGIQNIKVAISMSVLCFTVIGMVILFQTCSPLSKYRKIVVGVAVLLVALILGLEAYAAFNKQGGGENTIIKVSFELLSNLNYVTTAFVIVVVSAIYIAYSYIVNHLRKKK